MKYDCARSKSRTSEGKEVDRRGNSTDRLALPVYFPIHRSLKLTPTSGISRLILGSSLTASIRGGCDKKTPPQPQPQPHHTAQERNHTERQFFLPLVLHKLITHRLVTLRRIKGSSQLGRQLILFTYLPVLPLLLPILIRSSVVKSGRLPSRQAAGWWKLWGERRSAGAACWKKPSQPRHYP